MGHMVEQQAMIKRGNVIGGLKQSSGWIVPDFSLPTQLLAIVIASSLSIVTAINRVKSH
jgi:hypothetical protein